MNLIKMDIREKVWTEKYRPSSFSDIALEEGVNHKLLQFLSKPAEVPSFIFYSSAGTGKTSSAYLMARELGSDTLVLNASDERGIDTIREKITSFAMALSSVKGIKRLVIMEESDQLTSAAQNSLRNVMETYSDNVFFIFTCNDISKIIEPIQSRCVIINFSKPDKEQILKRLINIAEKEKLNFTDPELEELIEYYYPDVRSMVIALQEAKITGELNLYKGFEEMLEKIKEKDFNYIASKTFSGSFDIKGFNRWLFRYIFKNYDRIGFEQAAKITKLLAEIEMNWNLGVNLEIIFLANLMEISNIIGRYRISR